MPLGSDTVRIIWSYHSEDPALNSPLPYHGRLTRGARSVFLKGKPNNLKQKLSKIPNLKTWDILARNIMLPEDDHTHYWCQIFKAPDDVAEKKHHMIGVRI